MSLVKVRKLGRGSYGTVFLVKNKYNNNKYAQKKIFKNELNKEIYYNEINILKNIKHINIVKLHFFIERKDYYNIFLEYIDGKTLEDLILENIENNIFFSHDSIKKYTNQINNGLNYLHSNNIIHRDLKPGNIMITPCNVVKIMDFGVSKQYTNNDKATTFIGTPYYIAPEIINNEEYDIMVDYWSLGCTLYEMITNSKPFKGLGLYQLMLKIKNLDYKIKMVPYRYREIIINLLIIEPEKRYGFVQVDDYFNKTMLPKISNYNEVKDTNQPTLLELVNYYKQKNL